MNKLWLVADFFKYFCFIIKKLNFCLESTTGAMVKNQPLMSQKEKDYIASCFNKSANSAKTELNYEDILEGKKIEYDLKEDKREFKIIFGKAYRRSRKHLRPSSNTQSDFLEKDLLIAQLYETLSILKYLEIDNESFQEIESSIAIHFKTNFHHIINNSKIYNFLSQFFQICSEPTKVEVMAQFYKMPGAFENCEKLFNFLDSNLKIIPVTRNFVSKSLWLSNSGCLLALFLLLKDQSLFTGIYQTFINSKLLDCEYLHKFLVVMLSLCDKTQASTVETKLKEQKIKNINILMGHLNI